MYTAKDFTHLLGLTGFSDTMLNNHFTLYGGYVTNTNKLIEILDNTEKGTPLFNELNRRFGWEWNGMRMHELYFENMTKNKTELDQNSELYKKIVSIYKSYEAWVECFTKIGMMRGIGWVVLYRDEKDGELLTEWIAEHDGNQLVGLKPLLVMDCWEHAYMTDYGIKRADYINAFMGVIDWAVVEGRLTK